MRRIPLILVAYLAVGATGASAYNLFGPYDWGGDMVYPKWGDIHAGQPGGTVTWSIMPDGTTIDPSFNDPNFSGTSSFHSLIQGLGEPQAMAAIQRAFDHWSAVANIYFVQVEDSGLPFHHPDALPPVAGSIRSGAFNIAGNAGAVGYSAPPNGPESLPGDILFNASNHFQFAAGNEGDEINFFQPPTFLFHNDFEGLFLHELGHTLGLAHSDQCSVMSVDFDCYKYMNRLPDPDDIAAVEFLYGRALKADFNHDNAVRTNDLAVWAGSGFPASGATQAGGDADRDGDVDGADLLVVQREMGSGLVIPPPGMGAIPEPGAATLLVVAGLGVGIGRRHTWRASLGAGLVA